jgi:membrane-associated phospholipid phosphatase
MKSKCLLFALVIVAPPVAEAQSIDLRLLRDINPQNPCSGYWMSTSNSAYLVPAGISLGNLAYGFIYKDEQAKRNGFETTLSVGMGILLSGGFKEVINRKRPHQSYPGEISTYTTSGGKSFPSGHATLAFSVATSLSLQYKKWYVVIPAYAWASSVAYSRMYLGRHYPTDVLAGAVVGIGSGYLSHWLTKKIFPDKKRYRF